MPAIGMTRALCGLPMESAVRSHAPVPIAFAAAIAVLLASPFASAQSAPPPEPTDAVPGMTLAEAVAYARDHHPLLHEGRAEITARRADADVPRAQWLPSVGGTAQIFAATANNSTALYQAPPDLDVPRIGGSSAVTNVSALNWTPYASTLAAVGANQEIYDFGRIAAESAVADVAIERARHHADALWLDVRFGVQEAFDAVLAAHAVLTAADDAFQRATAHSNLARAWVTQGLHDRIELERALADLARYDVGRIRAAGGVEAAQSVLAAAVGYQGLRLDASGEGVAADAMPSLEEALRQAAARDPRLLEIIAHMREQHATTVAIGAQMRPNVVGTATISARAGGAPAGTPSQSLQGDGFLPVVPNWNVGVMLNWPIFDPVVRARRNASAHMEAALQAQVDVARQMQVAAIQRAWVAATLAQRALPALERAVASAHANYDQAEARFHAGLGTSVELVDAQALRTDAEIQLAIGRFEVARSRAQFARAIAEGP